MDRRIFAHSVSQNASKKIHNFLAKAQPQLFFLETQNQPEEMIYLILLYPYNNQL